MMMPTLIACSDALSKQFFVHKIGIHALQNYLALPVAYKPLMRTRTWLASVFLPAMVQPGQHFEFKKAEETDFFFCFIVPDIANTTKGVPFSPGSDAINVLLPAVSTLCFEALNNSFSTNSRAFLPPLERTSLFLLRGVQSAVA
jgi:hypothetical protein